MMRSILLSAAVAGAVLAAGAASASELRPVAKVADVASHVRPAHKVVGAVSRGIDHPFAKGAPVPQVVFIGGFEAGETGGPPLARDDAATVSENAAATSIDVRANDLRATDATIASVGQPANGTVSITGGGTGLTYQPNPDSCGPTADTFGYTLAPGGTSAVVAVTVVCDDSPPSPVAVADSATVSMNSPPVAIDVIANDTDTDANTRISAVTQPANGVVAVIDAGERLTYAPDADYCNTVPITTPDTFTYTLTPGGSSATVSVEVTCITELTIVSNGGGATASLTYPNGGTDPVTQVMAVSPDPGPITYSIESGPDETAFIIDPDTGELRFAMQNDAFPPDTGNDFVYQLTVGATQGGNADTQDLSIELIQGLAVVAKYVVALRNGESTDLSVQVLDADGEPEPGAPFQIALGSPAVVTVDGGVVTATGQPSANSTFTVSSNDYLPWDGWLAVRNIVDIAPGYSQPNAISTTDDFSAYGSNTGTPSTSYYADLFRVTLPVGQVVITMDSGDVLDTYLLLANADGFLVAGNDDDETGVLGLGSRIEFNVTEAGVYLIEASTFNGLDTGNYTMTVQTVP